MTSEAGGTGAFGQGLRPRAAPAGFAALLLSGMALAGLPPLDGFIGKALVSLAGIDKSSLDPFYALAAAVCLLGVATAVLALARVIAGIFSGGPDGLPPSVTRSPMEGAVALGLVGGCLLLGLFPGILLRNFTAPGSRVLFSTGFTGPGIAFRGTGEAVARAFTFYLGWAPDVAAFLLAATVLVLVAKWGPGRES